MQIGSLADILTAMVAFVGVVISVREYVRSNKLKRSSYIEPLIDKMKSEEISEVVYRLQYGKFDYSKDFHGSGEMERKVDKTLQYFSYLCYLRKHKIISEEEFSFFEFEISQSLRDNKLIDYLYNLFHFVCRVEGYDTQNVGIDKFVYSELLHYAKEKELIDDTFFDRNAYQTIKRYHRNINI